MTSQLHEVQQRVEVDHQNLEDLRRQFVWGDVAVFSSAPQPGAPGLLFLSSVEGRLTIWKEKNTKILSVRRHFDGHVFEAEKGEFFLVMGDSPERPLLIIPSLGRFSTKEVLLHVLRRVLPLRQSDFG